MSSPNQAPERLGLLSASPVGIQALTQAVERARRAAQQSTQKVLTTAVSATSELILSRMTTAARTRANTIAKTELNRIANGSAVAGVQIVSHATGERFLKRWLCAAGAEHPRHDDYEGPDGQTRSLEEPFDVGGYPADYPSDPTVPPEESIARRCTVVSKRCSHDTHSAWPRSTHGARVYRPRFREQKL